jgi:hypothetical protein
MALRVENGPNLGSAPQSGLSRVDDAICLIIARAENWHSIELALDALLHARIKWKSMENKQQVVSAREEAAPMRAD